MVVASPSRRASRDGGEKSNIVRGPCSRRFYTWVTFEWVETEGVRTEGEMYIFTHPDYTN